MGFGLYQQQTLKLVMTPELRQAITILQYSAVDLLDFLHQQANENPVLDLTEKDREFIVEPAQKVEVAKPEIDWQEYARVRATGDETYASRGVRTDRDYDPLDFVSANETTLESHLLEQIAMMKNISQLQHRILKFLIGNLNENGFLMISNEEAAEILFVTEEEIRAMVGVLQSLDPVGVGARNLVECLLLQIQADPYYSTLAYTIVENHLEDLAEKRYQKIAGVYGVTLQEVQEVADYLRTLNPRPASGFGGGTPRYIVPDVTVEKVGNDYIVLVNEGMTPNLTINRFYKQMLQESQADSAQRYIQDKLNSAMWLIKSMEQRRITLYKVTQAIVDQQKDFFEQGVTGLKPMTLRDIAEKVELHESTISRATSNKYVQTPRGLFELKYFFTTGLGRSDGESASVLTVKKKLKEMIDAEDKKKPLSDQKIMDTLVKEGIEISRRTIAKYREELGIAASSKRKRF